MTVWEEPVAAAYYVIGADPAYGSSDWADRFCVQVYRVYADCLEQVAEFCTSELNTFQFAWVICYLAGAYKNSTLNLEVNGPGQAVINEMRNLKRQASSIGGQEGRNLHDVLGNMKHYLWRRNDSFNAISNSIGWVTTSNSKERMLNYYKDYFERNMLHIKSIELLDEMKGIVRDQGTIAAYGRGKDDRVIATALACAAFAEQVQPFLIASRITRQQKENQDSEQAPEVAQVQKQVGNYLKALGF
jgi:hypothetical protein